MSIRKLVLVLASVLGLSVGVAQAATVTLSGAWATFSQSNFNVSAAIDGSLVNNTGWAIDPNEVNQSAIFTAAAPVGGPSDTLFTFTLSQLFPSPDKHTIGKFKLSVTTDSSPTMSSVWSDLTGVAFSANPAETPVSIATDGTILLDGNNRPSTSVYTVTGTTSLAGVKAFRLDVLEDPSLPFQGPGRQPVNGNFVLTEFQVDAVSVPLPAAGWAGMVLLGGLGIARRLRRDA